LFLYCFVAPAIGQDKPNFTGSWQFDASKSKLHDMKMADANWLIEEGDNSIHITRSAGRWNRRAGVRQTVL